MNSQEMDKEEIEVLYNSCYGSWRISNKAKELYTLRTTNNSNNYVRKRSDPILIQIYNELGNEFDGGKYSFKKFLKNMKIIITLVNMMV